MPVNWKLLFDAETIMKWLLTNGVKILFIILGAYIVIRLLRFAIHRLERYFEDDDPTTKSEREKRAETLTKILSNLTALIVWGFAAMMVLKEFGVEIGPILAGAGIAGLAVGFGAQSLVKDFLNGIFIVLENEYRVGDVVSIGGVSGLVEKISLRTTILRDLEGKVYVVPNGQITTVTNMTKEWSRFLIDVGVAYKENVDHVMKVLAEVGEELSKDERFSSLIMEPLQILGVDSFGDSAVNIRVVFTTVPLQQWTVGREFRRRIKNRFDELGIEIPFPHRTVYLGEGAPMNGRLSVQLSGDTPPSEE